MDGCGLYLFGFLLVSIATSLWFVADRLDRIAKLMEWMGDGVLSRIVSALERK